MAVLTAALTAERLVFQRAASSDATKAVPTAVVRDWHSVVRTAVWKVAHSVELWGVHWADH